jgi:hypothetical protein
MLWISAVLLGIGLRWWSLLIDVVVIGCGVVLDLLRHRRALPGPASGGR